MCNLKILIMKECYFKKWSYAVALMGLLLLTSGMSWGQTVFVNRSTGNDFSGDGTSGNPFKTFTKGYSMVVSGGTLDLTGTFTWTDAAETGDSGTDGFTINKNITIQGPSGGLAVVQSASSLTRTQRIFYIPVGYNVTLKNLELRHGYTPASGPMDGGAIACFSNITILNCYIHSNIARQGCGIEVGEITIQIENSTIANNVSTQVQSGLAGAGILINGGTLILTNSIVNNNSGVQYGGGIYLRYNPGSATITNSLIVNNSSTDLGGGIGLEGTVVLRLKNSIIANNSDGGGGSADIDHFEGTITDNGYNIVEIHNSSSLTGTGTITGNQSNLFGTGISATPSLALNGATNGIPTIALNAGSIAINSGNSSANGSVSIPTTDQRGFGRNGITDIGSFEYNGIAPASVPTVSTLAVSSISATTATGNGTVTATGGANITERGIYYSTTNGFANGAGTKVSTTGNWSATGAFTQSITGLTAGTTYYVKAFATNSTGTGYGAQVSFATLPVAPTVNTTAASSIASTSATLGGNVTADGGAAISERGVVYSTSDATPTIAEGATKVTIGSGTGSFSQSVGSLTQGTTYYFNAYAINSAGTSYGTASSFTTLAPEINITGNGNTISSGDASPTTTDGTDLYFFKRWLQVVAKNEAYPTQCAFLVIISLFGSLSFLEKLKLRCFEVISRPTLTISSIFGFLISSTLISI
jgi:hypothetical protein